MNKFKYSRKEIIEKIGYGDYNDLDKRWLKRDLLATKPESDKEKHFFEIEKSGETLNCVCGKPIRDSIHIRKTFDVKEFVKLAKACRSETELDKEKCECGAKAVASNGQCMACLSLCPKKAKPQEELEVEELKLFFDDRDDCYHINNMTHHDSRIDILAEKINQLIKAHNALVKEVKRQ